MMLMHYILTALTPLLTGTAHAQVSVTGTATQVSGGLLMNMFGGGGFTGIAEFLRGKVLLILAPIGIFLVVRAGLRLINSQDDDKLTKAKNTIAATCVGLMFAAISDRLVMAFYTPGGAWNRGTSTAGATILSTEILGILNWAATFIITLGVLMIVVSGLKTVATFGGEDTGPLKRSVTGVATGILVITTSGALKIALGLAPGVTPVLPGGGNPAPAIARAVGIVMTLLGFTALIALGVIVYAGMMMVINWANEDQYNKSKSLIIRTCIGLAVMLLSGVIIGFIGSIFS